MGTMTIDGRKVEFTDEKNVLTVIRNAGINIPTLCYHSELSTFGACRLCTVEDDRGRTFASCSEQPRDGMVIYTNSGRIKKYRKLIVELLLAAHCRDCTTCVKSGECILQELAHRLGVRNIRFENTREQHEIDESSPSIIRDPNKCILCGNCVRACEELQGIGALGFEFRGTEAMVMPAFNKKITEEKDVMERLDSAFRNCEKLQNHVRLLLDKGGLYKTYNGNLLFHGSIPLNEDGSLKEVQIYGKTYKGKELYDVLETYVRRAFFSVNEDEKRKGRDIMWYIWAAPNSPLFGKDKMTTFERYFIKDKETHKETKNAYYHLLENENVVDDLLREFELDPEKGHIINGHVPVHQSEGESPVKCNGKVLVIDGGFSRPYQKVTGIAGYTLVYNSYGLILSAHEPFTSAEEAVAKEQDIVSNRVAVHYNNKRTLVGDTDTGTALKERISELIQLLEAYRKGIIKEKK